MRDETSSTTPTGSEPVEYCDEKEVATYAPAEPAARTSGSLSTQDPGPVVVAAGSRTVVTVNYDAEREQLREQLAELNRR